jgi:hypothetical protein
MGARKREKAQEKKANTRKKQADYERRRDAYNAKRRQAGARVLKALHRIFLVILAVGLMMRFARYKLENNEKLTRTTSNETLVELRRDVFGVAVRASLDTCADGGAFTTKGLTEARSKLKCLWPLFTAVRDANATYFVLRRRKCETWRLAVFRPVVGQAYAAHSIDVWTSSNVSAALLDDKWLNERGGQRQAREDLVKSLDDAPFSEGGWKGDDVIKQRAAHFRRRDDDSSFLASLAKVAPVPNSLVRLRGDSFYRVRDSVILEQYRVPERSLRRFDDFREETNVC